MAKAILVMDMPDGCKECEMIYEVGDTGRYYCYKTTAYLGTDKDILSRPDGCPLLPFPPKQDSSNLYNGDQVHDSYIRGLDDGYNALVDLLGGGQDG